MSSLADLPELVGFFSYSREDDEGSRGALSALRERIQHELRAQIGRTARTFRLWQDKEAIPSGTLWETEIKNAVEQAVFFIPIITPTVIASPYCRFELDAFLAREATLGRSDLVFPILYIDVPALADDVRRQNDVVLSLIAARQYVDWRKLRHLDVRATDVSQAVERFCTHIRDALQRHWVSPQERTERASAEAERQRLEAETKRAEEEGKQRAAEEERRKHEAEAQQKRAEAEQQRVENGRTRKEAEAKRRAEAEARRQRKQRLPRPAVLIGSIAGVALLIAVGAWLNQSSSHGPISPPPPGPTSVTQQTANAPLTPTQEEALKPKDSFQECERCPVMVVVRAGNFTMGSPANETGHKSMEDPQHKVTIAEPFAVGQFESTFDEWSACVADSGCNGYNPSNQGWSGGRRPVINVSWSDANAYITWIKKKTGKPYRLLSEAEYEYATRAGSTTAYPWGDAIGKDNANCNGCGSEWAKEAEPVGSFAANGFGLYDMLGNVWEWTEDCEHDNYNGAPTDGSPWLAGAGSHCGDRMIRGGSWNSSPNAVRSASRGSDHTAYQGPVDGFRVARTLSTR